MATDALRRINTRQTPQSEQADSRQVRNSAGGFTFTIDAEARLRRFLVLGTDGGTYYTSEAALTKDNAKVVIDFARTNGTRLVEILLELSLAGRTARQNPILFSLAAATAFSDLAGRQAAHKAIAQICRTGSQLFTFLGYCKNLRGRGSGLRRAVARWYTEPAVDKVAYQTVKYRQREGWSQRDVLRLVRPVAASYGDEPTRHALFNWIVKGEVTENVPQLVSDFAEVQASTTVAAWVRLIEANQALSWEMFPDAALKSPEVWEALIEAGMPQTALLRQLPRLTRLGVLDQMGNAATTQVCAQISNPDVLKKARVHPFNVLVALKTYAGGHSERGSSTWSPVGRVIDALDAAYYAAYGAVEPAGKRTMLALDVSGSMVSPVAGLPLSCREASAALALVTAATEPAHIVVGFTSAGRGYGGRWGNGNTALTPLPLTPRQRLDDAVRSISNLPFGGTDCALPMIYAKANNLEIDTFCVYTDNETWAGDIHPHQALRDYRNHSGIDARLIVLAMTPTQFSIADSSDRGMLDIAGLDSAVPGLISAFSRGDV